MNSLIRLVKPIIILSFIIYLHLHDSFVTRSYPIGGSGSGLRLPSSQGAIALSIAGEKELFSCRGDLQRMGWHPRYIRRGVDFPETTTEVHL